MGNSTSRRRSKDKRPPPPRPTSRKQATHQARAPPPPRPTSRKQAAHQARAPPPRAPSPPSKAHAPKPPRSNAKSDHTGVTVQHRSTNSGNAIPVAPPTFRPRPPRGSSVDSSSDDEDSLPPMPDVSEQEKSLIAVPPPRPNLESEDENVSEESLDFDNVDLGDESLWTDPWSVVCVEKRNMFYGKAHEYVCIHCHSLIDIKPRRDARVLSCSTCGKKTSSLVAQLVSRNASHIVWERAHTKNYLTWRRVLSAREEEALLQLERKMMRHPMKKLLRKLRKLGGGPEHAVCCEDDESAAQIVLAFTFWNKGKDMEDGYVVNVNPDSTLSWVPVGQHKLDVQVKRSKINMTAEHLSDVSREPFLHRLKWFKQHVDHIRYQAGSDEMRITLRRDHILEDSSNVLLALREDQLWHRAKYEFLGEIGMDSGGVEREWFNEVSSLVFMGDFGLFLYSDDADGRYVINRNSHMANELDLVYYRFAGRLIGKAIFDHCHIAGHLSLILHKLMLQFPISVRDLRLVDPQVHRSVTAMYAMDDVADLMLDFTYTKEVFGATKVVELKPGGADIDVNNRNVHEYTMLLLRYLIFDSITDQLRLFLAGFHEVIPPALLSPFNHQELEMIMCGQSAINVEDWKQHTTYRGEFKELEDKHPVVRWFWEVLESATNEDRGRVLRFTTGTTRVPIQGFKALKGGDEPLMFSIESISKTSSVFPRSHTCFNRLELPCYDSKEEMERFLWDGLGMDNGFNLE